MDQYSEGEGEEEFDDEGMDGSEEEDEQRLETTTNAH